MKFSEQLRKKVDSIWQASFDHPFVKGIADSSLPLDCFRYYILNDAYYLAQFAKVQSIGAAKSPDVFTTNRMAIHAQGTCEAELALHEGIFQKLGITKEEQERFEPAPTAYAYTSHLYRAAYSGHLGDVIAALLPCYWLYYEIGKRYSGTKTPEPIYQEWIDTYDSSWFEELTLEQIERIDQIAERSSEEDRLRMEKHFIISSQYEYSFWEMAYRQEQWPV